ncbi:MAG: hypothetical protein KBD27_03560 [Candidatus Moranbacteria bacterium]|nr:hypothetical protein [Candidatus Moranbacteria bacterium]
MIRITKEVQGWVSPRQVMELFRSATSHADLIPPGWVGYEDHSLAGRSLTRFPGAKEPQQIPLPRGYSQPHLVVAPIEDVMGFSLTSVGGTKVVGGREWGTAFQVRVDWEVLRHRGQGAWHFLAQPIQLQFLGLAAEYPDHERCAIRNVLGYDPFKK